MSEASFIESVRLMEPYWVGRGVGGTLMFLSHVAFAYNVWAMRPLSRSAEAESPA